MAKPEGRYSLVDAERASDETESFRKDVKGHGQVGITIGGGALAVIATAALTWYASHSPATPADCASKSALETVDRKVDALSGNVAALAAKLNSDGDRAHNDLELVKLKLDVLTRAKP